MFRTRALLSALALGMATWTPLSAARLLGTTGNNTNNSTLVELDPLTGGLIQTIGSVGFGVNGLTYDAVTGILYGSARNNGGLIQINLTTGAGTLVGTGWNDLGDDGIVTLASNSTGAVFGWLESTLDDLVSVNTAAGTASIVGDAGIGTGAHGLAFNSADVLYLMNSGGDYFTIDPVTGASTLVNSLGQTAHHGDFDPVSGLYVGIDRTASGTKNLVRANLLTNTFTLVGTVDDLHTLTFIPDSTTVPEPSTWTLLGGGVVFAAWRRRRQNNA